MKLLKYIANMRDALRSPGAHARYFPAQGRKEANLLLARELAFGLKDYPAEEVKKCLGSLYGKIVVANSLDQTGVAIDNKEWLVEIRKHLREGKDEM